MNKHNWIILCWLLSGCWSTPQTIDGSAAPGNRTLEDTMELMNERMVELTASLRENDNEALVRHSINLAECARSVQLYRPPLEKVVDQPADFPTWARELAHYAQMLAQSAREGEVERVKQWRSYTVQTCLKCHQIFWKDQPGDGVELELNGTGLQ